MFFQRFCRSPILPELPKKALQGEREEAEVARDDSRMKTAVTSVTKNERAPMTVGQEVLLRDPISKLWNREGTVKVVRPSGRSYVIDTLKRLKQRSGTGGTRCPA